MGEDQDLEYHITFPVVSPHIKGKGDGEPVIIILGWVGCQDQQLAQYSRIYNQEGYTSIRYALPVKEMFFQPEKLKEIGVKIVELLFDLGLEQNTVLFHVFSTSGAILYRHISDIIHNSNQVVKVAGVIFDSAPGDTSILVATKDFYASPYEGSWAAKCTLTLLLLLRLVLALCISWALPSLTKGMASFKDRVDQRYNFHKYLEHDRGRYPQLFLYSTADPKSPSSLVEDFMERRQRLGVDVQHLRWTDSAHCLHLEKHPQEYIGRCTQFVSNCLPQ